MCIGLPGQIVALRGDGVDRAATVDFGSQVKAVSIITLPDLSVGDWIVVHSGFAVRRLTEVEAIEAARHFSERH